jgi:hypothetical protein
MLLISLVAFVSALETTAQEDGRRHEISAGAGILSTSNLAFTLGDAIVSAFDVAGAIKIEEQVAFPVYHISYKYLPGKRLGIGITLAAGSEKAIGRLDGQDNGRLKRFYANIAIEPVCYYLNRENFKLYGLVGAGLLYFHQEYTPNNGGKKDQALYSADFQITPIGIKVGNTLGAYLEAGIGYKGIISCGLFYRF